MFKTILSKTLYEKRWGILWWSLAMFTFTLLILLMYPIFQESFGKSLADVPESLRSIIGEASDYQRIEGFIELQVFMQMIFLTIIYGIILSTGLIAGEEERGTLQAQLSHPVSRTKVYFHKLVALAVMLFIVSVAMFVGIWVGALMIGESINVLRVLQGSFMQWLAALAYALLGFSLGAITGKRGMAGAVAGIFAFTTYMVSSLVNTVDALKYVNYLSPLKYFNNPRVLDNGLSLGNVSVLIIACIAMSVVGWLIFTKRDLYQR